MPYRFHARYTNLSRSPQSGHNDIYPQYYIWSNTYFISHQKMSLVFFRLSSILCLIYAKCLADDLFRFQALKTDFQRSQGAISQLEVSLIKCGLVCAYTDECSSINYNNVTKFVTSTCWKWSPKNIAYTRIQYLNYTKRFGLFIH